MIKGVNRQMIEIVDTGNPYFERALLVVQADMAGTDGDTLHREAQQILQKTGSCSQLRMQRRRQILSKVLLVLLSAGGGAALALIVEKLCSM